VLEKQTEHTVSISVLTAILPGRPLFAGARMSRFWILLKIRMKEAVVTTGAIRRAKLLSKRDHQQTNTHVLSRMLSKTK